MKKVIKVVVDPFCFRQFDKTKNTASFIDYPIEDFQEKVNEVYDEKKLVDGYAPFCKHLFIKNFTNSKVGVVEITKENEGLLRTAYEARTEKELAVLVRYFPKEIFQTQTAKFLDIILYSKEQIQKENAAMNNVDPNKDIDYDWGIVSVKPQDQEFELPMTPITAMRNALGIEYGGSGIALDLEKYKQAVEFWSKNALIK